MTDVGDIVEALSFFFVLFDLAGILAVIEFASIFEE